MEIERIKTLVLSDLEEDEDLYKKMKDLEEELEFIELQEGFIRTEQENIREESSRCL